MRWKEVLVESVKKYAPMFSMFVDETGRLPEPILSRIKSVEDFLKRQDRVIWALRWERYAALDRFPVKGDKEVLRGKLLRDLQCTADEATHYHQVYETLMRDHLPHWFSLNAKVITDTVFDRQSPQELKFELKQAEDKWKATRDQVIHHPTEYPPVEAEEEPEEEEEDEDDEELPVGYSRFSQRYEAERAEREREREVEERNRAIEKKADIEKFMDFGKTAMGEWAWWDLNRTYCRREGNAMGHCGNAPSAQPGDTVLSLRKHLGGDRYRPSLTFILHEDGYLGEMKGRANEKPKKEYHPFIVKLLKHPRIKGIRGGGYARTSNFSILDLDEAQREALIEEKPELLSLYDRMELYSQTGSKIHSDAVKEALHKDLRARFFDYHSIIPNPDKTSDFLIVIESPKSVDQLTSQLWKLRQVDAFFNELEDYFYEKRTEVKDQSEARNYADMAHERFFLPVFEALLPYSHAEYKLDGVFYRALDAKKQSWGLCVSTSDYLNPSSWQMDGDEDDNRPILDRLQSLDEEGYDNDHSWSDIKDTFDELDRVSHQIVRYCFTERSELERPAMDAAFDAVFEGTTDTYFSDHPDQMTFPYYEKDKEPDERYW